jgi:inosine-uridine nucleoside N-ribohydrolase
MEDRMTRLIAVLLFATLVGIAAERPIPVILDTDIGDDIDDGLALGFALQSPELDVRAINTVLHRRARRADLIWKILELYGRTDIPVGMGAEQPLLTPPRHHVIKQTLALSDSYIMPESRRQSGIQLLIETCMKSPDKITLIAYGPVTNLALALKAEPRIEEKIERIVLMNGYFARPRVEYNTYRDPEAAAIVFGSGIPIVSVGLDVTLQCRLEAAHLQELARSNLPSVQFLREMLRLWQEGNEERRPVLHDPLAVGVTFRPALIKTALGRVEVETRGERGRTYGMTLFRGDPKGTTSIATEVNSSEFVNLFMERLTSPPRGK